MKRDTLIYSVLIIGAFGAASLMIWWAPKAPTLGVVDMRLLISQRAQVIARPGVTLTTYQIKDLSQHLRDDLNDLARENGVILLTKGVVAAGELPDYTDAALSLSEEGERP